MTRITCILMARFILNLRQAGKAGLVSTISGTSRIVTLVFRLQESISSMGEELDHGFGEAVEDNSAAALDAGCKDRTGEAFSYELAERTVSHTGSGIDDCRQRGEFTSSYA